MTENFRQNLWQIFLNIHSIRDKLQQRVISFASKIFESDDVYQN